MTVREVELPQQFARASFRAQSFDERENTIECIWTTGATVRRRSWVEGPYDEALMMTREAVDLGRLNSGAPFLNSHDDHSLESIIGAVIEGSARIENGMGVARIRLSTAEGDRDNVAKIRDGVVHNISVGYLIDAVEKEERDGEVPLWRVTRWTPLEISAVPIPADPGAHIRAVRPTGGLYPAVLADRAPPAHVLRARMAMKARSLGVCIEKSE